MPNLADEINLIQTFSNTKVIGMTINHENMNDIELTKAINSYEYELGLPTTDALSRSPDRLAEIIFTAFPKLLEISLAAA